VRTVPQLYKQAFDFWSAGRHPPFSNIGLSRGWVVADGAEVESGGSLLWAIAPQAHALEVQA